MGQIKNFTSLENKTLPYSVALQIGETVLFSGVLPAIDAKVLVSPGDPGAQTRQIFEKIKNSLKACGLSINDVFRTTVILADLNDYEEFNKVYEEEFASVRSMPVRMTFGGQLLFKAAVEIAFEAVKQD